MGRIDSAEAIKTALIFTAAVLFCAACSSRRGSVTTLAAPSEIPTITPTVPANPTVVTTPPAPNHDYGPQIRYAQAQIDALIAQQGSLDVMWADHVSRIQAMGRALNEVQGFIEGHVRWCNGLPRDKQDMNLCLNELSRLYELKITYVMEWQTRITAKQWVESLKIRNNNEIATWVIVRDNIR